MNVMNKKMALTLGASVLSVGLLGGAAFAAFAPASDESFAQTQTTDLSVDAQETPKGDRLKAILDGLVTKGVITQAQEDKILEAAKEQLGKHGDKRKGDAARHVFANLMADSAKYLGLSAADLKTKLPGTSLGALADSMAPKSRAGLIASLTDSVNAAIAKAQADNKLTKEQADKARAEAPEHIAKFVDHKYGERKPVAPNARMFIGDVFAVVRDYTGLSEKDLMAGLRDGKSLAEIATGAGKTRDGLIKAIVDAANAKIDAGATGGKFTADQATQLKAEVAKTVPALVDRKGKLTAAR